MKNAERLSDSSKPVNAKLRTSTETHLMARIVAPIVSQALIPPATANMYRRRSINSISAQSPRCIRPWLVREGLRSKANNPLSGDTNIPGTDVHSRTTHERRESPVSVKITDRESEFTYPFGVSRTVTAVGTVVAILLVTGFAVHLLTNAGYSTLADVVWIVGYSSISLFIWRIWVRLLASSDQLVMDRRRRSIRGIKRRYHRAAKRPNGRYATGNGTDLEP